MHNKKLVWDKICQGMVNAGYSSNVQQCHVKVNNLKQKYRKIRDGNKTSGFGSFPCPFNFIRGHPDFVICILVDVNRNNKTEWSMIA